MKVDLAQTVDQYLETRRRFGFALVQVGVELRSLVQYAQQIGHQGPLTTALATQWAQQPTQCQRSYWALRLDIARRFAVFCHLQDPRTQIPPRGCFGPIGQRRAVHIYSPEEFSALCEASAEPGGHAQSLRGSSFCALLGLLYCTGLRIGEALGLRDEDINGAEGVLTVRHAKNGRSRLVPIEPSTVQALRAYRELRDQTIGSALPPRLFVNSAGKPLGYFGVSAAFRKICRRLGWTQPPIPRLHDLRHYADLRIMPTRMGLAGGRALLAWGGACWGLNRTRHNFTERYKLLRKASSGSSGLKSWQVPPAWAVLARACSLSARSASR